ncbi:hypothetical protein ASPVEDRAFT_134055 [Aspergillus versicolor CBS 583.65]|uniref:Nicotinamide N-methyltransferase n=1 Tax=Aspergillus versicolor CBS 583.65 TaxID=1036611 RepID=A0A1L9PPU3_ASPVE|nr:uncharacterized protein ASPVEDRAFT_134055 [Aspergillus versicolor CBS 583.65]OJJ03548.1 hypothetical protein ASPVEDRAFT_134055 [Aspergillus versicolor CBS 583.65]
MLHTRLRPLPRVAGHPSASSLSGATPGCDEEFDEDPEDLFASFIQIPHLFPDDIPHIHGDSGQHLIYSSPRYGDIQIMVPSYPGQKEDRKLQAHFLWSSGMVVAEGIEHADSESNSGDEELEMWKVRGEKVLELGAGAALPSITAALAKASAVTITDHPSSTALGPSGAISFNVKCNLSRPECGAEIDIRPHEWGTTLTSDPWAVSNKGLYTRIIAADCYWMSSQHKNLVRTMKWFLAPTGKVCVVAGFHTGRAIVAEFFQTAVKMGLEVEKIYERDLNSSLEEGELRREWVNEREGEGVENRRRWCVIAVLKHASSPSST